MNLRSYLRNYWLKYFFKEDDGVFFQQFLFFKNIRDRVENKAFDIILLQQGLLPMGVGEDIRKYYKYEGALMVLAPQDNLHYEITVWKPL